MTIKNATLKKIRKMRIKVVKDKDEIIIKIMDFSNMWSYIGELEGTIKGLEMQLRSKQ